MADFQKKYISCLAPTRSRQSKHLNLYEKGTEKLEDDLNIVGIIKNLKNFKILMQDYLIKDDQMKFEIEYHDDKTIDLDSDRSSWKYKAKKKKLQ